MTTTSVLLLNMWCFVGEIVPFMFYIYTKRPSKDLYTDWLVNLLKQLYYFYEIYNIKLCTLIMILVMKHRIIDCNLLVSDEAIEFFQRWQTYFITDWKKSFSYQATMLTNITNIKFLNNIHLNYVVLLSFSLFCFIVSVLFHCKIPKLMSDFFKFFQYLTYWNCCNMVILFRIINVLVFGSILLLYFFSLVFRS